MSIEALLSQGSAVSDRRALKLTHVGEQTGPVPTVVVQVYFYLPSLEKFRSFQSPGVSYVNDELPTILNFATSPDEFSRALEKTDQVRKTASQGQPSLSFVTIVDAPEGIKGAEILFTYDGGVELHRALADAIDQDNKIGQLVLQKQREAAYTASRRA